MPSLSKSKPIPVIPPYGPNAVEVSHLTFAYNYAHSGNSTNGNHSNKDTHQYVLNDINFTLEKGSRCLLIGANGSGKSTLLRILAGRHLPHSNSNNKNNNDDNNGSSVKVLGLHAFHDTRLNFHRAYLDCDWGMRSIAFVGAAVPLMADMAVRNMMEKLQAEHPARRDELLDLLGIDLDWRMHQLSDGQRRRVQIFLGLIRPFQILCLDEVTTSLDVVVRQDLLRWLIKESHATGATILYATHIFDGLDDWATHLLYLTDQGRCGWQGRREELNVEMLTENGAMNGNGRKRTTGSMLAVAEYWLRGELAVRRQKQQQPPQSSGRERALGILALENDVTDRHQGGYASGRMLHTTTDLDTELPEKKKTGLPTAMKGEMERHPDQSYLFNIRRTNK